MFSRTPKTVADSGCRGPVVGRNGTPIPSDLLSREGKTDMGPKMPLWVRKTIAANDCEGETYAQSKHTCETNKEHVPGANVCPRSTFDECDIY